MGAESRANPFAAWKKTDQVSQSKAYDRNGRELGLGDTVHVLAKTDIMWRVVGVQPVLDPRVPPGTLQLQLTAVFITGVQGGMPILDILKTKDAEENAPVAAPNGEAGDPAPTGSGIIV